MSTISDKATVTLNINGKQAKKMLAELEADIQKTAIELTKLETTVGDTKETRKKRGELKALQRQWDDMNSAMTGITDVMANLDKVSLGQLDKALKALQKTLRGTAQDAQGFDEVNQKMRIIKEQIERVRAASDTSKKSMEDARNVLRNMDSASISDLQKAYNAVNKELEKAKQGTAEYKRLQAEAKLLKERLTEVKAAAGESGTSMANVNRTLKNLDRASMQDLDKALVRLNQDLKKLKPGTREFEELSAKVKRVKEQMEANKRATDLSVASMREVAGVLKNIDKATPRELEKALKTMRERFKDLRKGTAEYERMAKAVRDVEKRLTALNRETRQQESLWSKISGWWFKSVQAVAAFTAGLTATIMSLREIVDKFATMEEAMANTRKYTRMTEADVMELNEAFKGMDTRSGREQLNLLAQEGGRLGKNTVDTVREYVEAADIINVALVDLGAGATQQIAKIANIFRIEDIYGVREGMLKVGSTVNVLSQNCTAAKPYIVEFTKRMSGIGVQAGMTVPEIMAFAATLDAAGQKCEMSASAVSRTLMMLFQKPGEIAKTMKMDVNLFEKTLKENSTKGLLMFLDRLHAIGKDDALAALAQLFKEMGMNGIRLSQVLATLSDKTDFLRWEIDEANKAFREGTSATSEFEIFNNTVQASIEKAKYRFHELSVELGSYLAPYMKHLITSSSAFVRVLLTVIKFVAGHKTEIASLIVTIAAYNIAANIAVIRTKAMAAAHGMAAAAQLTANVAMKAGALLLALLSGNVARVTAAWKAFSLALHASPLGLVVGLLTAAGAALFTFAKRSREAREEQERLNRQNEEFKRGLRDIKKATAEGSDAERVRLKALYKAATDLNATQEERLKAAEKLQKMYPDVFSNFDKEAIAAGTAQRAYADLAAQILQTARVRAAADKIVQNEMAVQPKRDALADIERKRDYHQGNLDMAEAYLDDALARYRKDKGKDYTDKEWELFKENVKTGRIYLSEFKHYKTVVNSWRKAVSKDNEDIGRLKDEIGEYDKANEELYAFAGLTADRVDKAREDLVKRNMGMKGFTEDETGTVEPFTLEHENKKHDPLREHLDRVKAAYEGELTALETKYAMGAVSYRKYIKLKNEIDMKYVNERIELYDSFSHREAGRANVAASTEEELAKLKLEKARLAASQLSEVAAKSVKDLERELQKDIDFIELRTMKFGDRHYNDERGKEKLIYEVKLHYYNLMRENYKAGSKEREEYDQKIDALEVERKKKISRDMAKAYSEFRAQNSVEDIERQRKLEMDLIGQVSRQYRLSVQERLQWEAESKLKYASDTRKKLDEIENKKYDASFGSFNADARSDEELKERDRRRLYEDKNESLRILEEKHKAGIISEEEYQAGKLNIERKYRRIVAREAAGALDTETRILFEMGMAWFEMYRKIGEGGKVTFRDIADAATASLATITAGLDMATQFMSIEYDIQAAKVERRYEKEIEAAKGNSNKVKRLEEQRDKELEAVKREQSKKEFAVNIIKAVAQTAQNALMAYGAMVGIPVVGPTLAAAAAATATAMGMIQVALLKKQQQLAEAQGYSSGGFTPPGDVDEPAGIVHAGEWVASQRLLKSPVARPIIEALDYAQRTNTIGSLGERRSFTATGPGTEEAGAGDGYAVIRAMKAVTEAVSALKIKLDEPFFTVNTYDGDFGIKQAKDKFSRMIYNKGPK